MNSEPFVSVITPVYNGEAYLSECIESVLAQTYSNWEYVIVNNRSTDRSLEIATSYAEKDDRIRVHNNESFLGVMENLNHAFKQISPQSKYCKVIHADDWMFPECIERMVHHAEQYPSAGIINSYYLDDTVVRPQGLEYPSFLLDGREVARDYFLNSHKLFGAPSNLLIRSSLLLERERVYDPDNIHSDHGLCLDILRSYDYGFVHQLLTFSRRHPESHTVTVADKYGTYRSGRFKNLQKYGRFFLKDDELEHMKSVMIDQYYRSYSRSLLFGTSKKVKNYHFRELKKMDEKLNSWKLIKGILTELFSLRRNIEGVVNRVQRMKT